MQVGPYQVLGELARGGMGAVYRARDVRDADSGREVALKVLHGLSEQARRRFAVEVGTLRRLAHPHVIRVHESGEVRGVPWLAMELHPGGTLERRLSAEGPLPPREAAGIAHLLAQALAHAHACGVLHRDVKPDNVLLAADGRPVLSDFGLARDLAASQSGPTRTGAMLGTPGYWAPEQVSGQVEQIGPAADVWGLGATLFALLSGRAPFLREGLPQTLHALEHEPAPAPSSLRAGVDPGLDAVVLRCLEKDPARRYPGAEALARDLAMWLGGKAPLASRAGRPTPRRVQRRVAVGAGVLALLAAGGLAGGGPPAPATRSAQLAAIASRMAHEADEVAVAALVSRIVALNRAGDLDGALVAVDELLRADPASFDGWSLRTGLLMSRGEFQRAHADNELALLVLAPDDPARPHLEGVRQNLLHLSRETAGSNLVEGRLAVLALRRTALDLRLDRTTGQDRVSLLLERAALLVAMGELDRARADLDAAAALERLPALAERACLLLRRSANVVSRRAGEGLGPDEQRALVDAQTTLRLDPQQPRALLVRGWLAELQREGAGRADLLRARELAPDDPDVLFACAMRLSRDPLEQLPMLELAVARDPWHAIARMGIVSAHMTRRDVERARESAREALAWLPAAHPEAGILRLFYGGILGSLGGR